MLNTLFASTIARWLIMGALASSVAYATWVVRDYRAQGVEIAHLQAQLSSRKNEIDVLKTNNTIAQQTIMELDSRLKQAGGDLDAFCKILGDVRSSKAPDADQPAGGPIGDVFEALKKKAGK